MHTGEETKLEEKRIPLVSLVGQPNSGKTTIFNFLSGKNYKTVNYPGSTVDYSISKILDKHSVDANILDSPGIISLIPSSPDEKLSVDTLYSHPKFGSPDLVAVTVDSSQLSRHLLLVKQLINTGFDVIVILTMKDILNKKGFEISEKRLSELLGCDVVSVNGKTGLGINELLKHVRSNISNRPGRNSETGVYGKHESGRDSILNTYKEIEHIENEVIYRKVGSDSNGALNLSEINEKIVILNSPQERNKPDSFTLKLDNIVLHRYWGLLIFLLVMSVTFSFIFWLASPLMDIVSDSFAYLSDLVSNQFGDTWYGDLLSGGVIDGLGSVLVFLPQILILFLLLGLLEGSGYLARGAMLVDKPLSKIGLNGKSFVPMLSGFACAIPAIMATRTILNRRERLLTIFIIPLMSCSARLPVYALLIGFLFSEENAFIAGLSLTAVYIFSIASSVVIASVVNKLTKNMSSVSDHSSFILELPAYRMPKFSVIVKNTFNNAMQYVRKAGPVILLLSVVLWFLTYFPNTNPVVDSSTLTNEQISEMTKYERISTSYASDLGKYIEPVLKPLGLDWRVGISLVATLAAREVFVSALALIFRISDTDEGIQSSLLNAMHSATIEGSDEKLFTVATSVGLIVFFVFALQCISTLAIVRKETGSWTIPALQFVAYTALAYVLALIAVNGLRMFGVN